ncbi:MFS transporter [Piscinibacter gummiphilus]|uniref:MFS transporter n=1 Tax=Piscinibacter gummiphilus TaxID=946333 RepID=A0ABZ0CYJ8_9BURK|nr:MFS transporter [Piscinibacter gummiphilus]WOB10024.1 MFS transporter [Piscinibacter gummiphilus]
MSTPLPPERAPLRTLPAFMRFWYARLAGTTGNQMLMVALGWQMYDLTGSAWDLGLVGLLQFLPALLLTLVAGHVADRHDRSRILALAMAAQTVVAIVLMLATHGHWASRWLLLVLSVAVGTAKAFQMPAQQALVPSLVPASALPRALAFSSAGMQAAIVGGPALGGFVYVAGADVVYATCAACFIAAGVLFLRIGHPHVPPPKEPVSLRTVLAGFQFIWQRPVVLGAISLDLFAVLLGGATALLPMFAKDVLHVGPWGLGLLRGAPAAGALCMSLVLTRWPISRRVGHVMFAAVAVYGLATMVFGVSTSFVLSLVALWVSGAADMVSVVIRQSLVQLETPDAMRGRVAAVNSIFIGASNQLGEFESGATAAVLGPVGSVLLGGAGTLFIAGLWFKLFPDLARRERLTERA